MKKHYPARIPKELYDKIKQTQVELQVKLGFPVTMMDSARFIALKENKDVKVFHINMKKKRKKTNVVFEMPL